MNWLKKNILFVALASLFLSSCKSDRQKDVDVAITQEKKTEHKSEQQGTTPVTLDLTLSPTGLRGLRAAGMDFTISTKGAPLLAPKNGAVVNVHCAIRSSVEGAPVTYVTLPFTYSKDYNIWSHKGGKKIDLKSGNGFDRTDGRRWYIKGIIGGTKFDLDSGTVTFGNPNGETTAYRIESGATFNADIPFASGWHEIMVDAGAPNDVSRGTAKKSGAMIFKPYGCFLRIALTDDMVASYPNEDLIEPADVHKLYVVTDELSASGSMQLSIDDLPGSVKTAQQDRPFVWTSFLSKTGTKMTRSFEVNLDRSTLADYNPSSASSSSGDLGKYLLWVMADKANSQGRILSLSALVKPTTFASSFSGNVTELFPKSHGFVPTLILYDRVVDGEEVATLRDGKIYNLDAPVQQNYLTALNYVPRHCIVGYKTYIPSFATADVYHRFDPGEDISRYNPESGGFYSHTMIQRIHNKDQSIDRSAIDAHNLQLPNERDWNSILGEFDRIDLGSTTGLIKYPETYKVNGKTLKFESYYLKKSKYELRALRFCGYGGYYMSIWGYDIYTGNAYIHSWIAGPSFGRALSVMNTQEKEAYIEDLLKTKSLTGFTTRRFNLMGYWTQGGEELEDANPAKDAPKVDPQEFAATGIYWGITDSGEISPMVRFKYNDISNNNRSYLSIDRGKSVLSRIGKENPSQVPFFSLRLFYKDPVDGVGDGDMIPYETIIPLHPDFQNYTHPWGKAFKRTIN